MIAARSIDWLQLGHRLATTWHIPSNNAENIEKFIKPALGKPDLILAYVPDTRPDTDFLCSFHPLFHT